MEVVANFIQDHWLRWAIWCAVSGKTVQTFAGHSSLQVTMDRYGHLFPSDNHNVAIEAIAGELMG